MVSVRKKKSIHHILHRGCPYHGLVRVLLELDEAHPGDVVHARVVGVLALQLVALAIEVGQVHGGRRDPDCVLAVHFVRRHIVRLQKSLRRKGKRKHKRGLEIQSYSVRIESDDVISSPLVLFFS